MNSLSKALIVVVLVLSIAYVVVSMTLISHQVNWYHRSLALRAELDRVTTNTNTRIHDLEERINSLYTALNDKEKVLAQMQKDADGLRTQLTVLGKEKGDLEGQRDAFKQRYDQLELNSEADKKALAKLREDYKTLQEEIVQVKDESLKLQDKVGVVENKLILTEKDRDEFYRQNKELQERVSGLEQEVKAYRTVYGMLPETLRSTEMAKPPISGQVIAISKDPGVPLVVLGVGKNEGVEPGFSFIVYRGDKFLGKVVAQDVLEDMTAARVDPRFQQPNATISVGDSVTTRLTY